MTIDSRKGRLDDATDDFYLESRFLSQIDTIRDQYDTGLYGTSGATSGISRLSYAFCPEVYEFLTANTEHLFSRDSLDSVLASISDWSTDHLGTSFVSTPQLRVFIKGCSRKFANDAIDAKWHYMIWLTVPSLQHRSRGVLRLVTNEDSVAGAIKIMKTVDLEPQYNDFIVHPTGCTYAIEIPPLSMDPSEGIVFLDGYLW